MHPGKEEGMAVQKFQVIFENQITKVFVKKTASDTKELLEGAKLAIYQGNTCIESWITEKEEHCVEGLEVGKNLYLAGTFTGTWLCNSSRTGISDGRS